MNILLASASPRRKQLLEELGHRVTVVRPDFDETQIRLRDPAALVCALAEGKGRSVSVPGGMLLVAADTVVCFEGRILGKPESRQAAANTLRALSGRVHEVYTGVYIEKGGFCRSFADRAEVCFRSLSEEEIQAYIATGSPMDKAGAYGVQDSGFVSRIRGSFHTVMGFPTEIFQQVCKEILSIMERKS